jgi:thiamine kinase-like enzyme
MTPEAALATIPGFSNASIGMMLADGPTAVSMLLEHFESKYVLRVDKPSARELGMDRRAEEGISRMVAAAGLAPELVYIDHDRGVSLRRFVPGTNWLESDLRNTGRLKRLAALLRTMHQLPSVEAQYDPAGAVRQYAEHIDTHEARKKADEALAMLEAAVDYQDHSCLCHNDLLNHNILESDRVMLIDWEFAGMGDPWFDLAIVVQHHGLEQKFVKHFLTAYLKRKPDEADFESSGTFGYKPELSRRPRLVHLKLKKNNNEC